MMILNRLKLSLDKALFAFVCVVFLSMVLVSVLQVVLRYFFNAPLWFVDEFASFALIWVSLLGGSWVLGQKGHMAMDFMLHKIEAKYLKTVLNLFINIVIFIVSLNILILGGNALVSKTMSQLSSSMQIPMGYIYFVLPFSGVINAIYLILDSINLFITKEAN